MVRDYGPARFATMAGSSIAAPDAAPWVTDFLNAAYYRRGEDERAVDDLRLALCVLTTAWSHKGPGRRLRLSDLAAFHRAFGADRFATGESGRGTLSRRQLLAGGDQLLGDWFSGAYGDDARRGWGIAFPTVQARAAHDPGRRLALAKLGELTPAAAAPDEQTWHTYPPVAMPSAAGAVEVLRAPERWPDLASEIGRFTPMRRGGPDGQTFEIEVAAGTQAGRPVFTRGYVTVTHLAGAGDTAWWAGLAAGLADHGEAPALPRGATPVLGLDLTTHQGHFMGAGRNRVLVFEDADGRAWARAVGTWDPMPWHLERAYRSHGRAAQHDFWTGDVPARSFFCQLAARA